MNKPSVYCITATCGRHTLLERLVATFMSQDYQGPHTLLIYNNSEVDQKLGFVPSDESGKSIMLINNHLDRETGEPYTNLGAIYRDALSYVPEDVDIVTHTDDDDIFLPDHISEGIRGYNKARVKGMLAYKPERSWFRHPQGLDLMGNNLEPSIFVSADTLSFWGYSLTTSDQHLRWFLPLLHHGDILVDPKGKPTLIYNWGDNVPTFKTSGNADDPNNFNNYRTFSRDHGDKVIIPNSRESLDQYYNAVKAATPNVVNG